MTYADRKTPDTMAGTVKGKCRKCRRWFTYEELDAKPEIGDLREEADFTRLECKDCYGPGYCTL